MRRKAWLIIPLLVFFYSAVSYGFSEIKLEQKAEKEGFGYKTSNLLLLERELGEKTAKSIAPFLVQVPKFIGLTSFQIQDALSVLEINLAHEWKSLVSANLDDKEIEDCFSNKILPQKFIDSSNALADHIENAFYTAAQTLTSTLFAETELSTFIQEATMRNWKLMVRSTGKEDTKKLANAGGNLSIANVPPDAKSILTGIGKVVASYFRERSLTQRLIAQDKTLFDAPLTPVLIQRMVGESISNELNSKNANASVGCVVYTREMSGKTPGLSILQCTYGHNEAVVQSLLPVDTFYVSSENWTMNSIIKEKRTRLVPSSSGGLKIAINDVHLQKRPCLTKEAVQAIAKISKSIEDIYQMPMDIELVYEKETKTIFVVQARPIVVNSDSEQPSYIAQMNLWNEQNRVNVATSIPGDGATLLIHSSQEILVADTLEQALDFYVSHENIRALVKVIVVSQEAEPTSHAAATFRGERKVVVVNSAIERMKQWLQAKTVALLVDVQRGVIVNLAGTNFEEKNYTDLVGLGIIRPGWITFPIPLEASIIPNKVDKCRNIVTDDFALKDTKVCVPDKLTNEINRQEKFLVQQRKALLCDQKQLLCLAERIRTQRILPRLEMLNSYAYKLIQEKTDAKAAQNQKLELFYDRFLESVIYQEKKENTVNSYSFASLKKEFEDSYHLAVEIILPLIENKSLSLKILQNIEAFSLAEKGAKAALTQTIQQRWLQFIDAMMAKSQQQQQALTNLVENLESLEIFSLWLNSEFALAAKDASDSTFLNILQNSLQQWNKSSKEIDSLREKLRFFQTEDILRWKRENLFKSNFKAFKEIQIDYFMADDFFKMTQSDLGFFEKIRSWFFNSKSNNPFTQMGSIILASKFINSFDAALKTLKQASYKNEHQKVRDFKLLLSEYLKVLEIWASKMPPGAIVYNPNWPLEKYISVVKYILGRCDENKNQLFPSPGFNVAAAALGNGSQFLFHLPLTLEDIFTLVHQSLNGIVSTLMQGAIAQKLQVPTAFSAIHRYLQSMKNLSQDPLMEEEDKKFTPPSWQGQSVHLVDTKLSNDSLTFSYQIPLRDHSALLDFTYEKATQSLSLQLSYFGIDEQRWREIGNFAKIWSFLLRIPTKVHLLEHGQGVVLLLPSVNERMLKALSILLEKTSEISFWHLQKDRKYWEYYDRVMQPLMHEAHVDLTDLKNLLTHSQFSTDFDAAAQKLEQYLCYKKQDCQALAKRAHHLAFKIDQNQLMPSEMTLDDMQTFLLAQTNNEIDIHNVVKQIGGKILVDRNTDWFITCELYRLILKGNTEGIGTNIVTHVKNELLYFSKDHECSYDGEFGFKINLVELISPFLQNQDIQSEMIDMIKKLMQDKEFMKQLQHRDPIRSDSFFVEKFGIFFDATQGPQKKLIQELVAQKFYESPQLETHGEDMSLKTEGELMGDEMSENSRQLSYIVLELLSKMSAQDLALPLMTKEQFQASPFLIADILRGMFHKGFGVELAKKILSYPCESQACQYATRRLRERLR